MQDTFKTWMEDLLRAGGVSLDKETDGIPKLLTRRHSVPNQEYLALDALLGGQKVKLDISMVRKVLPLLVHLDILNKAQEDMARNYINLLEDPILKEIRYHAGDKREPHANARRITSRREILEHQSTTRRKNKKDA